MSGARRQVLLFGIDAAEHALVLSMIARGKLPALAALLRQSTSGQLDSPADLYSGAVWPTFYTGQRTAWHGVYHNKLWRPQQMCCVVPDERTFAARPFWEGFADQSIRSCIVDVPLVLGTPREFDGVYVGGWATHDPGVTGAYPATLWRTLRKQFGARTMPAENFGQQSASSLLQLYGELLRATQQLQRISTNLLSCEPWDFACIVFGAAHRAGHYLWDSGEARDLTDADDKVRQRLDTALDEVYAAIDHAIGQLLAECSKDAIVLVFALHGMGPNTGWSEIVPDILAARRSALSQQVLHQGALYKLRRALVTRARPILQHMPPALAAQLVPIWSSRMFDWAQTRFFPLPMDLTAFLRINLRGRERAGIVAPGAEYDAQCAELVEFFQSLRDADTATPIVADIVPAYAQTPAAAPQRAGQPDLIVRFNSLRTRAVQRLTSAALPTFQCQVPRHLPSGRSGNHLPLGWFMARGPGIEPGATLPTHDILDLAPTVRQYLGLDIDSTLHGRPLPLTKPESAT
jgi:predicted AlkP superfamily phosphohydrolase/phosphomutase